MKSYNFVLIGMQIFLCTWYHLTKWQMKMYLEFINLFILLCHKHLYIGLDFSYMNFLVVTLYPSYVPSLRHS